MPIDLEVEQMLPLSELVEAFFAMELDLIADPFPLYRRLREEAPVFIWKDMALISRYKDIHDVIVAPTTYQPYGLGTRFRSAVDRLHGEDREHFIELFEFFDRRLTGVNGERHRTLRRYFQPSLTPRLFASMEEQITDIASTLLDEAARNDTFDFVNDFAWQFPLIVICEMLGIPAEDRDDLRRFSMDLGRFMASDDWARVDALRATYKSFWELRSYLSSLYAAKELDEVSGLLRPLLTARRDESFDFGEDDLNASVQLFVVAGHETTTNLISLGTALLLGEHRDQWDMIKADHSLIPNAVEEILRFQSPTVSEKVASEDCEVHGITVEKYQSMIMMWAAANRDPDVFEDPDIFDITRKNAGTHLGFGFGAHHCLGAPLARFEAAIVFKMMAERTPNMRLVNSQLTFAPNWFFRQLESLDVALG